MSDSPDPKVVRTEETIVVDFATPLKATKVATVFYAYDEGCDDTGIYGDGYFAYFDDALWVTARTYANEEYGLYRTPPKPLTWRKHHHLWRLHDGDSPTDIVVSDSPLLGSKPDVVLPLDDGDVRVVAAACSDFGNDEGPRGIRQLYARFAERIAALEARDAKGGER